MTGYCDNGDVINCFSLAVTKMFELGGVTRQANFLISFFMPFFANFIQSNTTKDLHKKINENIISQSISIGSR